MILRFRKILIGRKLEIPRIFHFIPVDAESFPETRRIIDWEVPLPRSAWSFSLALSSASPETDITGDVDPGRHRKSFIIANREWRF
jgi:hypothetical protein